MAVTAIHTRRTVSESGPIMSAASSVPACRSPSRSVFYVSGRAGSGRRVYRYYGEVVAIDGGALSAVSRVSKLPTWTRAQAATISQGRLVLVLLMHVSGPYDVREERTLVAWTRGRSWPPSMLVLVLVLHDGGSMVV